MRIVISSDLDHRTTYRPPTTTLTTSCILAVAAPHLLTPCTNKIPPSLPPATSAQLPTGCRPNSEIQLDLPFARPHRARGRPRRPLLGLLAQGAQARARRRSLAPRRRIHARHVPETVGRAVFVDARQVRRGGFAVFIQVVDCKAVIARIGREKRPSGATATAGRCRFACRVVILSQSGGGGGPGAVNRTGTHVRVCVVLAREGFAALVTPERLFLRVNGPVPLRVFESRESSLAASDAAAVPPCRIFEGG